jgi:hypothetical protein
LSIFAHFLRNYEGDPLSPPEGEAAQGEHPLDPLLLFPFFSFVEILDYHRLFHQNSEWLSHRGGCDSGGGAGISRSPQERYEIIYQGFQQSQKIFSTAYGFLLQGADRLTNSGN